MFRELNFLRRTVRLPRNLHEQLSKLRKAEAALRQEVGGRFLDGLQRQAADIDEAGRGLDLQLHQVEQVGAAGQQLDARFGRGGGGLGDGAGAFVGEGLHGPATSRMAARMCG